MRKAFFLFALTLIVGLCSVSFKGDDDTAYRMTYRTNLQALEIRLRDLRDTISLKDPGNKDGMAAITTAIWRARIALKLADFWLRYLAPASYRLINGPLPVEWETEVFEKYEPPYKKMGAGLSLASLYLEEHDIHKDSLLSLVNQAIQATTSYEADSATRGLRGYDQFFFCNRLYLLNLAAIYTTGFECPTEERIIPELKCMLAGVADIYKAFGRSFRSTPLTPEYLQLYNKAIQFTTGQPDDFKEFDHFSFIKDYINPLFALNQEMIIRYSCVTGSMVDYSLNKRQTSIFDKDLYKGQNAKGIFLHTEDKKALEEIEHLGRLLFYDPILSGNNKRSCASCHKPEEFFTDTTGEASLQYNHRDFLPRNTPSLINAGYNHLLMLDGKHFSLQDQTKAVITSSVEMGGTEEEVLKKVMGCREYSKGFESLLRYTPTEKQVGFQHIVSAITFYYSKFSCFSSPFDEAMNGSLILDTSAVKGFNLFMSKAQCGTCHFVPQFNGVKPPYVGSEFEVLGVPADKGYKKLSEDKGRYIVNPAGETLNAFRTGTIRNAARTVPYMHNGVFRSLNEVIDFYDKGGGAGRGLQVSNQTLSADSLKLTVKEKAGLIAFINALNENIVLEGPPDRLPVSRDKNLNSRKPGGEY